jgi:hypothetical protein
VEVDGFAYFVVIVVAPSQARRGLDEVDGFRRGTISKLDVAFMK